MYKSSPSWPGSRRALSRASAPAPPSCTPAPFRLPQLMVRICPMHDIPSNLSHTSLPPLGLCTRPARKFSSTLLHRLIKDSAWLRAEPSCCHHLSSKCVYQSAVLAALPRSLPARCGDLEMRQIAKIAILVVLHHVTLGGAAYRFKPVWNTASAFSKLPRSSR